MHVAVEDGGGDEPLEGGGGGPGSPGPDCAGVTGPRLTGASRLQGGVNSESDYSQLMDELQLTDFS